MTVDTVEVKPTLFLMKLRRAMLYLILVHVVIHPEAVIILQTMVWGINNFLNQAAGIFRQLLSI